VIYTGREDGDESPDDDNEIPEINTPRCTRPTHLHDLLVRGGRDVGPEGLLEDVFAFGGL